MVSKIEFQCAECGVDVVRKKKRGQQPKYCSQLCRQRSHNQRKAKANAARIERLRERELHLLDPLVDLAAVAAYLGMSPRTVYRLVRDGSIPGMKIGKQAWRFRISDVAAAIGDETMIRALGKDKP